jgi:ABC-2 type transport system permease protein
MLDIAYNFDTPAMTRPRLARAYVEEFRSEVFRHLRMPGFIVPTLLFPSMFYAIFYCLLRSGGDSSEGIYWLADYATFGAMAPGLYAFGISVAHERENGFLTFKRALPVPEFAYPGAKLALSVLVATISVAVVLLLAWATGNPLPNAAGATRLVLIEALGSIPFCALGLLIGSLVRGQSAVGVVNILYMPLAFLSGLLVPLSVLPHAMHGVAAALPGTHLFALALAGATGTPTAWPIHVVYLVAFAVLAGGVAQWRLKQHG